jgi:hypothetical protein
MFMDTTEQHHPANTVFLLLEDRSFRFEVIKPGLLKEKHRLGKLVSGKHQVKGFRHISKAPVSMIIPAVSEEVNVSPELAQVLLQHWFDDNSELKELVASKLSSLGYEPKKQPFDDNGNTSWLVMKNDHADAQYKGTFLEGEDENGVMLMSLLLGWFGNDEDESSEADSTDAAADKKADDSGKKSTAKKAPKNATGDEAEKPKPKAKPAKKASAKADADDGKAKAASTSKKAATKKTGATKDKAESKGKAKSK